MSIDWEKTKRKDLTWEIMKDFIETEHPEDKAEFKKTVLVEKEIKGKKTMIYDIIIARKWFVEKYNPNGKKAKPSVLFKDW